MSGTREDTRIAYVKIDGVDYGAFDKTSGGDPDSEELKYTAAGGVEEALGGRQSADNLTVSRIFKVGRDDVMLQAIVPRRGRAAMQVRIQPTDADYVPFGRAVDYGGTLKRVGLPDTDSESNDAALVELELSAGATVAA